MNDEVFVCGDLGLLVRIAALIDALNAGPTIDPLCCPTDNLGRLRRANRIDPAVLAEMTDARRDEPVLVACLPDPWVIDGNYRLAKRIQDGFKETEAVLVPPDLLIPFISPL